MSFEKYMKDFKHVYKNIQLGEDGIWELLVENGDIEPYSNTELSCYQMFECNKDLKKFIRKLPKYCIVTQKSEEGIVFKFPNHKLQDISILVNATFKKYHNQNN